MMNSGKPMGGSKRINKAAEMQPRRGGQGDMSSKPANAGGKAPNQSGDSRVGAAVKSAIDSLPSGGNMMSKAKAELHAQHPIGYDDRGPHNGADAWMGRNKNV